jgi:predicted metal-dependent peptidase
VPGWWGTSVVGVDEFSRGSLNNLASAVKPIGGGGTDPSCIPAWMKKEQREYVCAVVVTDGEFGNDVGQWNIPVLWLVVNNGDIANIPIGKVVHIKEI